MGDALPNRLLKLFPQALYQTDTQDKSKESISPSGVPGCGAGVVCIAFGIFI